MVVKRTKRENTTPCGWETQVPVGTVPPVVDHPAHYKAGGLEAIDVIEALGHGHGFCLGNAIKYLWRAGKKTPDALADLRKARWYVDRAIAALDKGGG